MNSLRKLINLFILRLRYPASLPENISRSLGISIDNAITFNELLSVVSSTVPTKLKKFMPRKLAEKAFTEAMKQEKFQNKTIFSYYFNEGWLEFILHFDENGLLRRLYVQHKRFLQEEGIEIPLKAITTEINEKNERTERK